MNGHALNISSAAIELIKKHQGLSLEKYRDEKGVWVIGYGHVIRERENFHGLITPLQAEYLLHEDIQLCETLLREKCIHPLTQQQHDALVLMILSFGVTSSLPKALLQGRRPGVVHGCLGSVFYFQPAKKRFQMRFYRGRTDVEIATNFFV